MLLEPTQLIYLKANQEAPMWRGALEVLVWNCAQVLDMDDYFVPTALFDDMGCIQPHVEGKTLEHYLTKNYIGLSKEQMITGVMLSLVLGFSDANTQNILIDKKNQLHFIDNSRCFPHSNGLIRFGNDLITSFRCGLSAYSDFFTPLSYSDRQVMVRFMGRANEKLPEIIKAIKNTEAHIPRKDWFHVDKILDALNIRVERMSKAVQTAHSLRDLVFAVHHQFRFAVGLGLVELEEAKDPCTEVERKNCAVCTKNILLERLHNAPESEKLAARVSVQTMVFPHISGNGFSIREILNGPTLVDLRDLYDLCANLDQPFDRIIDWIASFRESDNTSDEMRESIWNTLQEIAVVDHKT